VDLGAAFVADEQALEVVEPGEGAFDDPAEAAEAGAVLAEEKRSRALSRAPSLAAGKLRPIPYRCARARVGAWSTGS
jgi:hypothetical protein